MFDALVGQSPNFVSLLREARWIAASDANVLLIGETGTGKTALARALQQHSTRAKQAFVSRNCAALPVSLAAPALFGEDGNADPGATNQPAGWLAAAHGGTVFLDEVDALPAPLQAKLLQFLETGALPAFGHASSQQADVRFIATSHPSPHDCSGLKFRRELRSRLRHPVVSLEVPPLRERSGDVQLLISHFSERFSTTNKLPGIALSKTAMSRLVSYSWPGNVRELRSVCERLCILQAGHIVEESHLPAEILCRMPARTFSMADGLARIRRQSGPGGVRPDTTGPGTHQRQPDPLGQAAEHLAGCALLPHAKAWHRPKLWQLEPHWGILIWTELMTSPGTPC